MIVDFDDFSEHNNELALLLALKGSNPDLKVTLFAVPGLGSPKWWGQMYDLLHDWVEFAVHGWVHPDPYECSEWTPTRMMSLLDDVGKLNLEVGKPVFTDGFKAPGWQISDGCYSVLSAMDWWVADQPYNDDRRPKGLRVHRLGDGDHWHGHIQNVCGNGLQETFPELEQKVGEATEFKFISEVVKRW